MKRAIGSVALGFVLSTVVVVIADSETVPYSVRLALLPGMSFAGLVTFHGSIGQQLADYFGFVFWFDVAFYSAVSYLALTWCAWRHQRKIETRSQDEH